MSVPPFSQGLPVHLQATLSLTWAIIMASNISHLPNPHTPLAFLPPIIADQFQISCYVNVAGLSVSAATK